MNTRWLGTICTFGGLAYIVMAVYGSITQLPPGKQEQDGVILLTAALWIVGAICGWLGFVLIRGTGSNIVTRYLSLVPAVGWCIALAYLLFGAATGSTNIFNNPVFGIGGMLGILGGVLVAIFALATRALSGWHRFAPLFTVVALVVGGLIQGASSGAIWGIPLCLGVAFAVLGYAVQSGQATSQHAMRLA